MSATSKALYKPLSIATSVAGGLLAGKVFGLVRAAVDRAGAKGYRAITHDDPR